MSADNLQIIVDGINYRLDDILQSNSIQHTTIFSKMEILLVKVIVLEQELQIVKTAIKLVTDNTNTAILNKEQTLSKIITFLSTRQGIIIMLLCFLPIIALFNNQLKDLYFLIKMVLK